jgi:hypothetical protein
MRNIGGGSGKAGSRGRKSRQLLVVRNGGWRLPKVFGVGIVVPNAGIDVTWLY